MALVSGAKSPLYAQRRRRNGIAMALAYAATAFGLTWLVLILAVLLWNGFSGLSLRVFTEMTPPPGAAGGLLNPILGSIVMTGIAVIIGTPLGILAGISRRSVDETVVRLLDVVGAFPDLLLAILVVALIGPGLVNLILALGVASIPKFARVARTQTRTVMVSGYVEHARTLGQKRSRTIRRHVLPNAVGALPVLATIGLGYAIIGAAALSFLGLGPQPPTPEWGLMLSEAISNLRIAWWAGVFPGAMITLLVISLTVIGNRIQALYEKRNAA